jgi:hypothetical protein
MPDIVLSLIGGAVLALLVYALVTSIGMVLFKRIGQQNSEPVHLIYGIAGAIVGLIFGAFVLWLTLAGVRAIGAVADAQVRSQADLSRLASLRRCVIQMCDDVFSRSRMPDLRRLPHRWRA